MFHSSKRLMLLVFLLLPAAALAAVHITGDLPRQAELGFSGAIGDNQLTVARLDPASPAAEAGIEEGDTITAVNGAAFERAYQGHAMLEDLRGGQRVELSLMRDGRKRSVSLTPVPRPYEAISGVDTHYGEVQVADGSRLRTLITQPEGSQGPLPAIFFTQWVSCGSIEYIEGVVSREILARLAQRSGRALVRVERSTSGDSIGPACHELDYDTEIDHYVDAYTQLADSPLINARDVVVVGSSLGSTTAPLVALRLKNAGIGVTGVAIQGGSAYTHLERMINFDRIYLERRPEVDPVTIHQQMQDRIRFQYEYLVEGRDPDDIARDSQAMRDIRNDVRGLGQGEQYGRPYAWHQQAAKHNHLAAWLELAVPALVVFNEYEQFEREGGHKIIVDMLNRKNPGLATFVVQESIGHSNYVYPSADHAYAFEAGSPAQELLAHQILNWLKTLERR